MKYGFELYENKENIINSAILDDDEAEFSVLKEIVNGGCEKVFTDGKNAVICLSQSPMPVWVWAAESAGGDIIENIARCLENEFPLSAGYTYNVSFPLLKLLADKNDEISGAVILTDMTVYKCEKPNEPGKKPKGCFREAKESDARTLSEYFYSCNLETGGIEMPRELCDKFVKEKTDERLLFLWEDESGEAASVAAVGDGERYGRITFVYTPPEKRRAGYAENTVYAVAGKIIASGKTPMLYADSDYLPSNMCYKKLGFKISGRICTIGQK